MAGNRLAALLARLEEQLLRFQSADVRRTTQLLQQLGRRPFPDADSLIRFHEALLFLRAFPKSPAILRKTEALLNTFFRRVDRLRELGADLTPFEPLEVSGIAGTSLEDTFSYQVALWQCRRFPRNVEILWEDYEEERALANTWPRLFPLLEEDAFVEANIPWRKWLQAARGRSASEAAWLLERFQRMPISDPEKAEIYDCLRINLRWHLGNSRVSRTRNWKSVRRPYYQRQALITRAEVSLAEEFASPRLRLRRLSSRRGAQVIEQIHEVMAVRYRELWGTTLADPASVWRAELGRGVVVHLWGLPAARRLPLRAYLAGFTLKNGVPINYIEAITLFEWTEVGFNTFYTFRKGETAWIYARVLHLLRQLQRVKCISVYPYQIGDGNPEAIESGAFWFYRKLGFRPGSPELARLTEREEKKIAAKPGYRTPARTLRRLAREDIFYELPGAAVGAWDRFSTRNLGLAVNRRMARDFDGDRARMRHAASLRLARLLDVDLWDWSDLERRAFEDFAQVLELAPSVGSWSAAEKQLLVRVIRAKVGREELRYVRLLQQHAKLRAAMLRLGSAG
ncbi:MAG TPA: hypothetical protein VK473_10310 [Terriglobales bacterium]|nr:hypothetical protein [Terriglobales bacterium]